MICDENSKVDGNTAKSKVNVAFYGMTSLINDRKSTMVIYKLGFTFMTF